MSCRYIQEELYEHLGQNELPPDVVEHISQCDGCRNLWNELKQLQSQLGTDKDFYLDPSEIDKLTEGVMRGIETTTPAHITPLYHIVQVVLPIAASLLLLFGVSKFSNQPHLNNWSSEAAISDIISEDYYTSIYDDTNEIDAITFELLLSDYASGDVITPSETLLDDLSTEELEFLKNNLDMGELL